MADYEDEINRKQREISDKLKRIEAKKDANFSVESINEFSRGFYFPVLGSLEYLKSKTNTHLHICCLVSSHQIAPQSVIDDVSYHSFADALQIITPPVGVDFEYRLSDSVYPIGEVGETFSVYFRNEYYEIVYNISPEKEFRIQKKYMTHLEPNEIRELRDLICDKILTKVSQQLDELL